MGQSRTHRIERTLGMATKFLDEIRDEIGRAAREGADIEPRVRSVNERAGHATPEFRTLAIPIPDEIGTLPPDALSGTIARFAERRRPDCLMLAMEAQMDDAGVPRTLLIAEARDRSGTRMYWMQPFRADGRDVEWEEPLEGGWRDPGEAEMILDAAFAGRDLPADVPSPPRPRRRPAVAPATGPAADREVPLAGAGLAD